MATGDGVGGAGRYAAATAGQWGDCRHWTRRCFRGRYDIVAALMARLFRVEWLRVFVHVVIDRIPPPLTCLEFAARGTAVLLPTPPQAEHAVNK